MNDAEVRERVARVDALIDRIGDDPAALDALRAVVELYGEAVRRLVGGADPVEDELLSHLLVIHDLHPQVRFPGPTQPRKLLQVGSLR